MPVSRVIADRVLLFVVRRELLAERGAVCAGRRVNINNIVGVDSGARADIVLGVCNYRYLCACVLSALQAIAHVSHGVVVHLVALGYQFGILDGVKIFRLELLVLVGGNEIPDTAKVNNYIEQILMNDIVECLIEAVKAERLDEPLVFIFLAEAYLDILYERGDVKMYVALEQVNDELRSAYRGCVHYRAVYIALGIDMNGKKDVLGMYVGENESAKFWLSIMNGLKNRGVEDILIACVDGLNGFPQAIEAVYPKTEIQQCIIHQIRNTTNYVSYKDLKKLMADLKMVYAAPDEAAALEELESFGEKWNSKYPKIYKSWSEHWATLSTYFKYPNEVRKLIYTTNAIEGFNRQLRKVTKSKTVFPSDDSLLKMLYLATMDITKKWTGRRRDWSQIRAQLEIYFEERLEKAEF